LAVVEDGVRAGPEDDQSWSQRAAVAIATVSAYLEDEPDEARAPVPAAASAPLGRLRAAAVLSACVALELAWLAALGYLLYASGLLGGILLTR
jgi:hypothetical protein